MYTCMCIYTHVIDPVWEPSRLEALPWSGRRVAERALVQIRCGSVHSRVSAALDQARATRVQRTSGLGGRGGLQIPSMLSGAKGHTPELQNSQKQLPSDNAAECTLEHSSERPLEKWQSFGTFHRQVTVRRKMPQTIHWTMSLNIHNDF